MKSGFFCLVLLALASAGSSQDQDYLYITNNGAITITQYIGPGGAVTVPRSIDGLPVTAIADGAFANSLLGNGNFTNANMSSITVPDSVVSLGMQVFHNCQALTNIALPNTITNINWQTFSFCTGLKQIKLPDNIWLIDNYAFDYCYNLTSVVIPKSCFYLGNGAFGSCYSLESAYFEGNAPILLYGSFSDPPVFYHTDKTTVYYMQGTSGWLSTYGGRPTMPWAPQLQVGSSTNGFAFNVLWPSGKNVTVEACTNLANPLWSPLANILTGPSTWYNDPQLTNNPVRFYRVR